MKRKSTPNSTILQVIQRDNCTCQFCGKVGTFVIRHAKPAVVENLDGISLTVGGDHREHSLRKFELHHVKPVCFGGDSTAENLKLSCRACNRSRNITRLLFDRYRLEIGELPLY